MRVASGGTGSRLPRSAAATGPDRASRTPGPGSSERGQAARPDAQRAARRAALRGAQKVALSRRRGEAITRRRGANLRRAERGPSCGCTLARGSRARCITGVPSLRARVLARASRTDSPLRSSGVRGQSKGRERDPQREGF